MFFGIISANTWTLNFKTTIHMKMTLNCFNNPFSCHLIALIIPISKFCATWGKYGSCRLESIGLRVNRFAMETIQK